MSAGSRATRRGHSGARDVHAAPRADRRARRGALQAALLALALLLAALVHSGCQGCEGTSFGDNTCRSDLDCDPWESCSPGGACVEGADECRATNECPELAPAACAEAEVTCRGGQCRYDLDCLSLGGQVNGLVGRGLIIQNGDEQIELDRDDTFVFETLYGHNDSYNVIIVQQPKNPGQVCFVQSFTGTGRFNVSDVATVEISCSFLPEDQDGDGVCDGDTLADGCFNFLDNCPGVSNPDQADGDRDDVGDACDPCTDLDGDGYGRVGLNEQCPSAGDDCDDTKSNAHPGLVERCADEIDNDCDGQTDEEGCQKPYVAPKAVADSYLFDEDQPAVDLDVLANDTVWDDPSAALTITGTTAPSGNGTLVIAPGGTHLRYTPRPDYNGEETFAYSVADGAGGLSSATVTIELKSVNDPPTATPDNFTLPEDSPVATLDVLGNDSAAPDDGEPLSLVAIGQTSAGGTAQLLLGGNIQYKPAKDYVGLESFIYILSDGRENSTAVGQITITITPVNDVPYLIGSLPDQVVEEDAPWSFAIPDDIFADVDQGDILTLSATLPDGSTLPGWLDFDPVNRVLSGTAANEDVGQLLVDIRATDLGGASVGDVFELTVVNTNDAPEVVAPLTPQTAVEGTPWSFAVPVSTFTDVDAGDTMTYRATLGDGTSLPAWLTFDRTTRTFSGTPKNSDVGTLVVAVIATDRAGATATAPFDLVVRNINQLPTLAHPLADREATEDAAFSFVVPTNTFTDPDPGDEVLALSANRSDGTPLPSWLHFSATTRTFSGVPTNADVGALSIAVVATDSAGATAVDVFQLTVLNTNDPPNVATPLTNRSVDEGVSFAWSLPAATFSDPDVGDTLSFSAGGPGGSSLPSWLSFDPEMGLLQGLPGNAAVGHHTVVITARDVAGATATASFVVHVVNVNAPPVVATPLPDRDATEDAEFSLVVPDETFFDEDPGDELTLSAALTAGGALPGWLHFDPAAGAFSGTPANDDVGTLVVGVTATDLAGASVTDLFALTVANTNDAPTVATPIPARTSPEDVALTWVLPAATFADVDKGDALTWSVALADGGSLPGWLDFDPEARLLSGTPTNDAVGVHALRVTVADLAGATAHVDVDLTILNVNDPPQVLGTLDAATATEDAPFSWQLPAGVVVDVDPGDTLAFSATRADGGPLPGWLAFDPSLRKLTGTPRNGDVGTVVLTLKAVDLAGATASVTLPITVANTNDHPVVVTPLADRTVTARSGFAFFIPPSAFSDPDVGDTLSYFVTLDGEDGLPGFVTFDAPERVFYGTPADADVGEYDLRVTATDPGGLAVASVFKLVVQPAPAGDLVVAHPIIDRQATEEIAFTLVLAEDTFAGGQPPITLTADRSDGDPLPAWLAFDPATATFSGTPGNDDVGTLLVRVTASDAADNSLADVFAIEVLGQNDAPEVVTAIADQVALEGDPFVLAVPDGTFLDIDAGDVLSLSAFALVDDGATTDLPSWLTFFTGTGLFVGTPDNDAVGDLTVRVVATDLAGATAHTDFVVHVNDANAPPALTAPFGQIPATEDAELSWAIPDGAFVDPDPGDVLTLAADRPDGDPLPTWLTFDAEAGTLSGTPQNADVGVLSVRLTATDRAGAAASGLLRVAVANTNDAPEVTNAVPTLHAAQGIPFSAVLATTIFADPDPDDALTWSVEAEDEAGEPIAIPTWLEVGAGPPVVLAGTPGNADVGTLGLRVTVTDTSDASASQLVTVEVAEVNDPPRLSALIGDREATEDVPFTLALASGTFTDPDLGDTLALSAARADGAPLPGWLDFDGGTATFSGTPTNADVGVIVIRVTATDTVGAAASDVFTLAVLNVNDAPVLVTPPPAQVATEGVGFAWVIPAGTFFDPDPGEALTWAVTLAEGGPLPAWLGFDAAALLVSGTPTDADVGELTLLVSVTDLVGATASIEVGLTVTGVNDPPRLEVALPDQLATEDEPFSYSIAAGSFVDPDTEDFLTLTAHRLDGGPLPAWLHFDGVTFAGTPANEDVGVLAVEVTATDQADHSTSDAFVLTVSNVNDPPVVVGSVDDQHATVGATWAFALPEGLFVEVDPGDALALTAARASGEALPAWLTFYPGSGLLLGTPGPFDVGAVVVRVTATDLSAASAWVDFPLVVTGAVATPVPDTRAPRVLSHEPPDGAVISRSSAVVLRFDEPVDPASLADGVDVVDVALEPVPGTWQPTGGAWVFAPASELGAGDYAVFVGAGVTDEAGNALDESGPENDFAFSVAPAFASPAWRSATPRVSARIVDVAIAARAGDLTAAWLEGAADNTLRLFYRRSTDGGASWTAVVDAALEVAADGGVVALRYGDDGAAVDVVWMADDRVVFSRCAFGGACGSTTLGRYGGGVAAAADAQVWLAGDAVVWRQPSGSPGGAGLRGRRWDGASWSALEAVSLGTIDWATVAVTDVGDEEVVEAVWTGAGVAWRRVLGAEGWSPAEQIAAASSGSFGGSGAAARGYARGASGALFAWAEADGVAGAWRVHASRSSQGGWTETARDAYPGTGAGGPDAVVAVFGAAGEAAVSWQIADPDVGASRLGVDVYDGDGWLGATFLAAPGDGAAALDPPVLAGVTGDGEATVLMGWGDPLAGGAQLASAALDLTSGAASWEASALLEPRSATTGPWTLEGFSAIASASGRAAFASALGLGAKDGGAWRVVSARDALFGEDVAEADPEDSDVVSASVALGTRPVGLFSVAGDDVARVVVEIDGSRAELSRRGTSELGAAAATIGGLSVAGGPDGGLVTSRALASAPVPGGGACGALTEPVATVGRLDGASGLWGPMAVATVPPASFPQGCVSAFPTVVGQALAVDASGRAVIAQRFDGGPDAVRVTVVAADGISWSSGSASALAVADAEVDAVLLAAAGETGVVVVDDAEAAQSGARAVGVFDDLALLDGGEWTSTEALFPDATAVVGDRVAVAAEPGGDVVLVASVTDGVGPSGRLAWRPGHGVWSALTLTASGGVAEAPSVFPRVDLLSSGAARAWVEVEAPSGGGRALEAWDSAGPGVASVMRGRLALGARAVAVSDIAVRAGGSAVVVWVARDPGDTYDQLWGVTFGAGGAPGTPVLVVDPAGRSVDGAQVALDAMGTVVVVWRGERADGTLGVFYAASTLTALSFATGATEIGVPTWVQPLDVSLPLSLGGGDPSPLALLFGFVGSDEAMLTTW